MSAQLVALLAASHVGASVLGAVFHKWFAKQWSDAKIRADAEFNARVKAVIAPHTDTH